MFCTAVLGIGDRRDGAWSPHSKKFPAQVMLRGGCMLSPRFLQRTCTSVDWRVLIEARCECSVVATWPGCTRSAGKDSRNSLISRKEQMKKRGEWIDDLAYAAIVEKVTAPSDA